MRAMSKRASKRTRLSLFFCSGLQFRSLRVLLETPTTQAKLKWNMTLVISDFRSRDTSL